jgi:hypothetical protein
LRLIIQGVDVAALRPWFGGMRRRFRRRLPRTNGLRSRSTAKPCAAVSTAFSDRKAAHKLSALRQAAQIVLGHLMVEEKNNEIPAAPELIGALGLKGCVFTLNAEHAQGAGRQSAPELRLRPRIGSDWRRRTRETLAKQFHVSTASNPISPEDQRADRSSDPGLFTGAAKTALTDNLDKNPIQIVALHWDQSPIDGPPPARARR